MKITDFGVAVVETDRWLSDWVIAQRRLNVAEEYLQLFRKYIPVGGTVIDVGACIGDHTATYAEMVGQAGVVHAFEPNPVALQCLRHNMQGRSNVACHGSALGENTYFTTITNTANLGASQIGKIPVGEETGYMIAVVPMDSILGGISRCDFIKIDVEGYEAAVIRGGMKTIAKFKPVILVEINHRILKETNQTAEDIYGPLLSLGYAIRPSEPHHSLTMNQVDALCLPPGVG